MMGGKLLRCVKISMFLLILFVTITTFPYFGGGHLKYNYDVYSCLTADGTKESPHIPRHIHQMFFNITDKLIPERLENARKTWADRHLGFQYTLWNASMVENLIHTRYPQLRILYHSYGHWVRRADVARYIVLHEFGGIYIDLDIESTGKELYELFATFKSTTSVVLYLTQPPVVSNDFMISKSHHPFIKHVLCGLESANRWYVLPYITTLFTTGPMHLHAQFKSYSNKFEIELLKESVMSKFVRHIHGSAWHQWDGVLIWWIFTHRTHVCIGCVAILSVLLISTLLRKSRVLWLVKGRRCLQTLLLKQYFKTKHTCH